MFVGGGRGKGEGGRGKEEKKYIFSPATSYCKYLSVIIPEGQFLFTYMYCVALPCLFV